MRLAEGFVVGGRYRIEELLATGSKFRVYGAMSDADGPGRVAIKVARHDRVSSIASLQVGRSRVERAWAMAKALHMHTSSASPLPLELVHMYPGDRAVRDVAFIDKKLVRAEPYFVAEFANGEPLASVIQNDRVDEERALLLALRLVLVHRACLDVGWLLTDFAPSNFIVDHAGENLTLVDATGADRSALPGEGDPVWATFGTEHRGVIERSARGEQVPPALGRLLVSLLGGTSAPPWGVEEDDRERWSQLLERRRIPREFHTMLLGALGYRDVFEATPERLEQRIRALVRAMPAAVHTHVDKQSDTPYLIEAGETLADRFEVLGPLGQGGRGFVYRVRDIRSDVRVLVKANKYQYDSGSSFALELPTRRLELEHEFAILKTFASRTGMLPQPVALVRGRGRGAWFDLAPGLADGEPYLVMEQIKGIPLLDLLPSPLEGMAGAWQPQNRLRPGFTLRLIAQIAELLKTFHQLGFLVQDLKPENILFDPRSENVYLVDFAAVCPRKADGLLDKDSVAFGTQTHGFAAPEFAELWERCDDRFDIYSLGATAFHLLTGINPERLALEQGTEYPQLPPQALGHLPACVAHVVMRCLAPVEHRYRSADEAFVAAEQARLQLSRSRPLDVRGLRVAYEEDGARLRWHLPVDPRVQHVRVLRETDDGDAIVYDGEAVESWLDDETAVDRVYRVETALVRRGERLHSRGRSVRAEACPAPVAFTVDEGFGENLVRVVLAAHATDAIVRVSADAPPTSVDEGIALEIGEGGVARHAPPPGVDHHYAAFARYTDGAISAPRFATAQALRPLGEPGALRAVQSPSQVSLSWASDDPRWRIRARRNGDVEDWLDGGAASAVDGAAQPGAAVTYELVGVERGVCSEPRATLELLRWPCAPDVRVEVGPACVELDAADVDPRFVGVRVMVEDPEGGWEEHTFEGFPARVPVRPDVDVSVAVQLRVEGEDGGPGLAVSVVAPPEAPTLRVRVLDELLPTRIAVELPPEATAWSGSYRVEVTEAGQPRFDAEGPVAAWGRVRGDHVVVEVDGTATEPGARVDWAVRLSTAAGDALAVAWASTVARQKLGPPQVQPLLNALELDPGTVARYAVRIGDGPSAEVREGCEGPLRWEARPEAPTQVAWRLVAGDVEMPWSEPVEVAALRRPDAPRDLHAERIGHGVRLTWRPASPGAVTAVHATDGRLVYRGEADSCLDVEPGGAESYRAVTERDGLSSEAATSNRMERRPGPHALRRLVPEGPAPSPVRLLQCIRVSRSLFVAELATPGPPRDVLVVRAGPKGPRAEVVAALEQEASEIPGVLARTVSVGGRTLLVWRERGQVGIYERPWEEPGRAPATVTAFVEPAEGQLVGGMVAEDERLTLLMPRGKAAPEEVRVVAIGADGTLHRRASRVSGDDASARLPEVSSPPVGLALESAYPASVLVPVAVPADRHVLDALAWRDTARGWLFAAGRGLAAHWRAAVAAETLGTHAVFHLLHDGRHVEVRLELGELRPRGAVRVRASLLGATGAGAETFALRLDRPERLPAFVDEVCAWADDTLRQEDLQLGAWTLVV